MTINYSDQEVTKDKNQYFQPAQLPGMPGFTTNVEFGYWLYNVDTKQKPYNTIEDLLSSAMIQADNQYESKNRRIIKYEK